MDEIKRVEEVRNMLLTICNELRDLRRDGVLVEFKMTDNRLEMFRAFREMKFTSHNSDPMN